MAAETPGHLSATTDSFSATDIIEKTTPSDVLCLQSNVPFLDQEECPQLRLHAPLISTPKSLECHKYNNLISNFTNLTDVSKIDDLRLDKKKLKLQLVKLEIGQTAPVLLSVNNNKYHINQKTSLDKCETNGSTPEMRLSLSTHLLSSDEKVVPHKRRPGRPRKRVLTEEENQRLLEDANERSLSEHDDDTLVSKRSSRRIRKPQKFADYELNLSKLSGKLRTEPSRKSAETPYLDNIVIPECSLPEIEVSTHNVQNIKYSLNALNDDSSGSKTGNSVPKVEDSLVLCKSQDENPAVDDIDASLSACLFGDRPIIKVVESEISKSESAPQTKTNTHMNPLASLTDEGLIVIEPEEAEMQFVLQSSPPNKEEPCKIRRRKKNIEILESGQDVSRYIISRTERLTEEDSIEGQIRSKNKTKCLATYVQEQGIVRDGLVECRICGKSLKLCSFKQHLRTHEGVKPFECGICGSCFTRKGDAERHIRVVHKQENLYTCCKCGRNFQDKKNLRWHLLNHDKKMVYQCEYCGFKFGKKEYYDNHVKYIHELGILEAGVNSPSSKLNQQCSPESIDSGTVNNDVVKIQPPDALVPFSVTNQTDRKSDVELTITTQQADTVLPGRMFQMGTDELDAAALVRELESVIGQDQNSVIVMNEADLSKVLILNSNQVNTTKEESILPCTVIAKDASNGNRPITVSESKQNVLDIVGWSDRQRTDSDLCLHLTSDENKNNDKGNSVVTDQAKQSQIVHFLSDPVDPVKNLFNTSQSNELIVSDNTACTEENSHAILLQAGDEDFEQLLMSKDGATMLLIADGKAVPVQNLVSDDGQTMRVVMETSDGHAQLYEVEEISAEEARSAILSLDDSVALNRQ